MERRQIDQSTGQFWDQFAFWTLVVFSLLLPIFVLPLWGASPEIAKRLLVALVVIVVTLAWSLGRLRQGRLVLPHNYILIGGLLVVILSTVSALWSGSWRHAFLGFGYESDTALALWVAWLVLVWGAVYFRTQQRLLGIYIGLLVSAAILFLAQILAVLVLNFDFWPAIKPTIALLANNLHGSLVGKWHDFGVYAGFIVVLSLAMLEFFSLKRISWLRWLVWAILVLALVMVAAIDYWVVWIVLGVVGVFILIYKNSRWGSNFSGRILGPSLLVLLVAISGLIFFSEDRLGRRLGETRERLGLTVVEVKPSWSGTWQIANQTLSQDIKHFWFGAGPNRFADQWVRYKPATVNQTQFWNIDFRFGVGFLPSMLTTVGVLGLGAWLFFLGTILVYGFRAVFNLKQEKKTKAFLLLSWLGTVYLWLFSIIYLPDNGLLLLTFLVTGLFVAVLVEAGLTRELEFVSNKKSRFGLVVIGFLVLLTIGSIVSGYLTIRKGLSAYAYQEGLYTLNVGDDLMAARASIAQAQRLSDQDLYLRALSELDLALAVGHLNEIKEPAEADLKLFSERIGQAVASAQAAVAFNSQNYLNWLALGRVYETLVPLGFEGAYEQSLAAFTKAQKLNPTNPSILVDYLARLEISRQDLTKAENYAAQALQIKENYLPAVLLLVQLEVEAGRSDLAAKRLEQFLSAHPQNADAGAYFQLGYLKYQTGNYKAAAQSLSQAVNLVPNFANAKYFLGLSLMKLGRNKEALRQFREIKAFNSDHPDLNRLIMELSGV